MFLHMSVILSNGGSCRYPLADTPLLGRHAPGKTPSLGQTAPWQTSTPPPFQGRPLQRTVHILLECILVNTVVMMFVDTLNCLREYFAGRLVSKYAQVPGCSLPKHGPCTPHLPQSNKTIVSK